jgi:hypothetical protein
MKKKKYLSKNIKKIILFILMKMIPQYFSSKKF